MFLDVKIGSDASRAIGLIKKVIINKTYIILILCIICVYVHNIFVNNAYSINIYNL